MPQNANWAPKIIDFARSLGFFQKKKWKFSYSTLSKKQFLQFMENTMYPSNLNVSKWSPAFFHEKKNKKIWQQKWCMEVQSLYIAPLIHEKVFSSKSKLWQNLASGRKICSRCVKLVMINSLNFSNHFPVHWLLSQSDYLIYILSCFTFFFLF